jgi:trehalose 6-phosphate phosphatase
MIDQFFLPRMLPLANPPEPKANWALFLDLDGTLLDIAAAPDRVVVPPELIHDLRAAAAALGGALAIVSGRMLSEVDALLNPLRFPGGGEHGAVIRLPNGQRDEVDAKVPAEWSDTLVEAASRKAGILVERKTHSVVLHYRRAAHHEDFCKQICFELISGRQVDFEVLQGRMAVEVRPRTVTKARPVHRLMMLAPFAGRRPLFVGDDVTDRDGFRAAEVFGGEGIDVFQRFAGRPREVRQWLKSIGKLDF